MNLFKNTSSLIPAGICLLCALVPIPLCATNDDVLIEQFVSMAIQGDLSRAHDLFAEGNPPGNPVIATLSEQFQQRFHPTDPASVTEPTSFLAGVSSAYHAYWRAALLSENSKDAAERALSARLNHLLYRRNGIESHDTDVFSLLRQAYRDEGVGYFDSSDPPLHDLFLWQGESKRRFAVHLTDGAIDLEVRFLEGVLLQGWKDFASLGLATTTGWVEDGVLYCLDWAYDRDSENFRVSYLKHEARHLVDLERYPGMDSTELEYRAKLTELAFANQSLQRVLEGFVSKAARNPASPHAMANWRVVRDLYLGMFEEQMPEGFDGWGTVGAGKVNRVARILLVKNTEGIGN